jgi:hypothetical protein
LGKKRGGTSPFPTECLPSRMIINFLPLIFWNFKFVSLIVKCVESYGNNQFS